MCKEIPTQIIKEPSPNCPFSLTHGALYLTPLLRLTLNLPSGRRKLNRAWSVNKTFAQSTQVNLRCRLAYCMQTCRCLWVDTIPRNCRLARKPNSLCWFCIVCALMLRWWLPMIILDVETAVLPLSLRWYNAMCLSCRVVVMRRFEILARPLKLPVCTNFLYNLQLTCGAY